MSISILSALVVHWHCRLAVRRVIAILGRPDVPSRIRRLCLIIGMLRDGSTLKDSKVWATEVRVSPPEGPERVFHRRGRRKGDCVPACFTSSIFDLHDTPVIGPTGLGKHFVQRELDRTLNSQQLSPSV